MAARFFCFLFFFRGGGVGVEAAIARRSKVCLKARQAGWSFVEGTRFLWFTGEPRGPQLSEGPMSNRSYTLVKLSSCVASCPNMEPGKGPCKTISSSRSRLWGGQHFVVFCFSPLVCFFMAKGSTQVLFVASSLFVTSSEYRYFDGSFLGVVAKG